MTEHKFKKGDKVVINRPIGYTDRFEAKPGAEAEVLGHAPSGNAAIRIKGWKGGHDGLNVAPGIGLRKGSKECWFMHEDGLSPAPAPVKSPKVTGLSPKLAKVLTHLQKGLTLTQGEALVLGYGTRLADLVHRLRKRGYDIRMTLKHDLHGTPYGEYKLVTRNRFGDVKKDAA